MYTVVTLFVMYIILYIYNYIYIYRVCICNAKSDVSKEMTLGDNQLNFATSCKYFGHLIFNLSDESDIQLKVTCTPR